MQINRFDGGLNNRLAPHLLKSSESVNVVNLDPSSGVLQPFQQAKPIDKTLGKSFTWFNDRWVFSESRVSFATYNNMLIKVDGVNTQAYTLDGENWNNLRIEPPTKPLQVTALTRQNLSVMESVIVPITFTDKSLGSPYQFGVGQETHHTLRIVNSEAFQGSGKIFYKVKVKHKDYNIFTTFDGEATLTLNRWDANRGWWWNVPSIVGSEWYPAGKEELKFYLSRDDSKNKIYKRINLVAFPTVFNWEMLPNSGNILSRETSEIFDIGDIETFTNGDVLNYSLVWTNTNDNTKTIENLTHTLTYENSLCFGTKITKLENHTLEAYRNGKKCQLVEDGDYYFDYKKTKEANLGTIYYVYTYYSSITGFETAPSPVAEISTIDLANTIFQLSWDMPADPQIDKVRIYRYGQGLSKPSRVGTFSILETFTTDSVKATIDGELLNTQNNMPIPKGVKGIKSIYARLWAYKDQRLYFSDVGRPFSWSEFNSIEFDETITGFGSSPNGILVFAKEKSWLLTGKTPESFAKFILSNTIGCVYEHSIQNYNASLIWLGKNGIYASNGGNIINLTQPKLKNFHIPYPLASVVWADMYLLATPDNTITIDLANNRIFYISDKAHGFAVKGLELFHVDYLHKLYATFSDTVTRELEFSSATYAEGSLTNRKIYSNVYFHSTGNLQVKVYVDDNLAGETSLQKGVTELKLDANMSRGYGLRFDIKGSGTLNEIEYKAEGRQNGR